jgi:hypothetical protein
MTILRLDDTVEPITNGISMTIQTSLSRDTLHDFVEEGDALINFTGEVIAGSLSAVSIADDGTAKLTNGTVFPVNTPVSARAVMPLLTAGVRRFVVVSNGSSSAAEFTSELAAAELPHVCCVLQEACDADAFMDDDDSEAVALRLRQLGYI